MKLLFFNDYRLGVLKGDRVVDVTRAVPNAETLPKTVLGAEALIESVIESFDDLRPRLEALAAQEQGVLLQDVRVRPPVPRPPDVICAFSNYSDGVARAADAPKAPVYSLDFFQKSASAVVGHDGLVELPDLPDALVFQPEPEFAFVIGKQARNVPEAEALDYVFGYLNFSDISARGMPNRRTQFISKGQHSWAPMGPVIVTKDEIPDPQAVRVRLWLNGEQKQDYQTSLMVYPVAAQIAWLSQLVTLQPGAVVSTGTHHLGLSPINEGDVVEIEGDGLERLRFRIKSYGPAKTETWIPGPPQARPQH